MKHIRILLLSLLMLCWFSACRESALSDDPTLRLSFSVDTVCFDTVFTTFGSSTKRVMIYNKNRNAINISSVYHNDDRFAINLDGENDIKQLHDIQINGGDSLYLFVRVTIDTQDANTPVWITDTIWFTVNGCHQALPMEAYGQNVWVIRSRSGRTDCPNGITFDASRPYLIFDTIVATDVTIAKGMTLYMHNTASIYVLGNLDAQGTSDAPILIRGDRTDKLFDKVPYSHASGQWGGIFLQNDSATATYRLNYVDIVSGNIGLYSYSTDKSRRAQLTLLNSRIHNHAMYGLVLQNTDATVINTEISNCAAYCVYTAGGKQLFVHNTIASYFGLPSSNLNIHNVSSQDVAALYVDNLSKQMAETNLSIHNCIITGARKNNIVLATPLPKYYAGSITHNYIKGDTLLSPNCHDNSYAQDSDHVFVNTRYLYKEYNYYDFHLDSISAAIGIGDSTITNRYAPQDREGRTRTGCPIDAGCYQRSKN